MYIFDKRYCMCMYFFSRNKSLVALRERVERQRSVQATTMPAAPEEDNTFEGLNLELRSKEKTHPARVSVERLDTQVTTLHNDVAALSIEVRTLQTNLRFKS